MPLNEYTGTLGLNRAAHLLRRATFGPTKEQIETFASLTPQQAITQLFNQPLPDPILSVDPDTNQEWAVSGVTDSNKMDEEYQEYFKRWFIGQMLSAGVPDAQSLAYAAREKLVMFLHTHFTAIQEKINSSRALYFQNQLFRIFALDRTAPAEFNFRELTKKVSVDNAMLRLLDGNQNVKGSPNENYARELFELFSIGRGLEGSLPPTPAPGDYILFKEQDVQAAARVLSGFDFDNNFNTLDPDTNLPRGKVRGSDNFASGHDNGIKEFSTSFINPLTGQPYVIQPNPLLTNGSNATLASVLGEISQLIDMIYEQEETARHICRKVYRYYVYHEVTESLHNTIIAEMANTFRANGFKLQPVIENLLRSQHFYEAAAGYDDDQFGGIIKSPLDLIIGTLRFFNYRVPDMVTNASSFYEITGEIISLADHQGMSYYQPFDVAGYDAYHQFPVYHRSWITVNYLTRRYEFIRKLVNSMEDSMLKVDVVSFVRDTFSTAVTSNARTLIVELARLLLPVSNNLTFDTNADDTATITAERMNYFLIAFLENPKIDADPEGAWTIRWTNGFDPETVRRQLENLFNAMLQSPEYQLH
ncbi:MAG: DUF1800 domain-containing protein [Cyclobacteriaceae bacterium]|jgi:uncharacterized protein (DUF1800 family)|nr:DUF1800 domain-containing protein [Cyclobacteriaceae bacterium]